MQSDPDFIKFRMQTNLGTGPGGGGTVLLVRWLEVAGGAADVATGAILDGTQTYYSGTVSGFVHAVSARTSMRQFNEIKVGDLIVDLPDHPQIALAGGLTLNGSATVNLDDIADRGVRFVLGSDEYMPADVGEDLAMIWDVWMGQQQLERTMVLRPAT